ncbi:conserved hypothetical protein [Luteimonas sp. 9C]|uniref:retron Ec48 family effector membrane protein n=1 Tax=Luteimonas sp. 9C TaxID=2653148 RepID=UPI0012F389E3|nr:retron Ec48 family effector membrane protein [Luteimonas sp. 9C]VXC20277.1 conserved hypothetical protein [Luteimonas sp. 9C]
MLTKAAKGLTKKFTTNMFLWSLVVALAICGTLGIIISLASWYVTKSELPVRIELCLHSGCIAYAKKIFLGPLSLLNITAQAMVVIATVGGIIVALFSFFHTSRVSAFGNHVSHISVFSAYLSYEISKRDKIATESIDIYGLYSLMFSKSRGGSMDLSDEFIDKLNGVADIISESNLIYLSTGGSVFNLRVHQAKLKKSLDLLGIKCEITRHRMDFLEIEAQIFDLIDSIVVVFCSDKRVSRLPSRRYV